MKALKQLKIEVKDFLSVFRLFFGDVNEAQLREILISVGFNPSSSIAEPLIQLQFLLPSDSEEAYKK